MVHYRLREKIITLLKDGDSYSQSQIADKVGPVHRAILTGYLRCLYDGGEINSKNAGKAKIYSLPKRRKK